MKWFCAGLIALVCVFCTSCHRENHDKDVQIDKSDVNFVQSALDSINNPKFANFNEITSYQDKMRSIRYEDSVFCSLSEDVLFKVSQVVINKGVPLTRKAIVNEYLDGKNTYDYLGDCNMYKSIDSSEQEKCHDNESNNDSI